MCHAHQLTIIVRYVVDSGLIELSLKFLPLTSNKGNDMSDLVLEVLKISNIDVINCKGQSYDNASNMSDTYKEMQTERKKHCKYADYCRCTTNLLNLAGESSTCCCFESAIFFSNINELYNFFRHLLIVEKS